MQTFDLALIFPTLVLLPLGCSTSAVVPDAGTGTSSTSTGEVPDTPTSHDPTDPAGSSSTTVVDDTSSGGAESTGFADPGPVCGDGIQGPTEECDAGPDNDSYDWCTEGCLLNICGDGNVLVGTEECDEGSENLNNGYCRADCKLGVCGDGYLFAELEECDAGASASDAYGKCDTNCTINRCGDGQLDPGFEECDEGPNNGTGDGGEIGKTGCDLDCGLFGRRVFLSSQLFSGDMGTRSGADLACQNMAAAAEFKHPDRFRALLADAEVGPADFVIEDLVGRPFILPSGLIVAGNYADLVKNGPNEGIIMTETGDMVFGQKVWTNLNVAATAYLKDAASTCASWSSANPANSARIGLNAANPDDPVAVAKWKTEKQWLSYATKICISPSYRIYCIEAT